MLLGEAGIDYIYMGEELGGYRNGGYREFTSSLEFERGIGRLGGGWPIGGGLLLSAPSASPGGAIGGLSGLSLRGGGGSQSPLLR